MSKIFYEKRLQSENGKTISSFKKEISSLETQGLIFQC